VFAHQELGNAVLNVNAGNSQQRFCWVSICWAGSGIRKIATLESWNHVILEPFNPGILEPYDLGTLYSWNLGTLESWNPATWALATVEPCAISNIYG